MNTKVNCVEIHYTMPTAFLARKVYMYLLRKQQRPKVPAHQGGLASPPNHCSKKPQGEDIATAPNVYELLYAANHVRQFSEARFMDEGTEA